VVLDQSEPISTPSGALGYEIRTKRLRLGISQANLARDLGLSRTHLSALERGLYTPQMKTWQKVQTFLSRPVPGFDADVGNMSEMLDIIPSSPILNLSLNHPHRWLS
jgi:transcriptional regulator with XRE-family HTH domain